MNPHEDDHLELDHLRAELHQLERRIDALEHRGGDRDQPVALMAGGPATLGFGLALPNNAIPVAGRAVLGLAGAYLLRALAEADAVPRIIVVAVAILYAAAWLVFSVRARTEDAVAGATYGITAALILAPLLWEATVRFDVLSPLATAAILIAFTVLGSALAWSGHPGAGASVTTLLIVATAIALMIRTGDLVPFAAALLAIACIVEAGTCRGHESGIRIPVAIAADFAIWLLIYIMTIPSGEPPDYKPAGPATSLALCAFLFLIYAASVAWRGIVLRRAISAFEIGQFVAAFALAAGGALQITQGRASASVGALSAIASAVCYFGAFIRSASLPSRNQVVFASWGALLCLVACFLTLPGFVLTLTLSTAAVGATLAGVRFSQRTLGLHGALYLLAAGLTSGLPGSILNAFTGSTLEPATPALWIMAIAAACCYAASGQRPARASLVPALFATVSIGALSILAALPLIVPNPTYSLLATARTLVTCALALALGFAGSRRGRRDLVWLSYAVIALGTVKLLLEDFRQSSPAALAFSLVCYGALLILAPKFSGKTPMRPDAGV